MREALKTGPIEFRRAYLRMFVHRIVVSRREVRISGPKAALAKAASSDVPAPGPEVLSFIREWRPLGEGVPERRSCLKSFDILGTTGGNYVETYVGIRKCAATLICCA